jgi:hypothetical protein
MQLRLSRLPMSVGVGRCPHCKQLSDEFAFAESGPDGSYRTWLNGKSGVLYRQDLALSHHNPPLGAEEIALIRAHAGDSLREVPGLQKCKFCGTDYTLRRISISRVEEMDVFVAVIEGPLNKSLERTREG